MKEISGAKYVVVNIFEVNGQDYTTMAISGLSDSIRKASKILGFPLIGKKWPYDPLRDERTKNQSISRFENLMDFAGHALPSVAIRFIENTFALGEVLLAKIEKDGIVMGGFILLMSAGVKFNQFTLVDIYTRQVGLLLTRSSAELALRQSDSKFRDLFDKDLTGNFISTVDGEFILINEAFARIFGFDSVQDMMADRADVTYAKDGDRARFIDLVHEKKHLDMFRNF